MSYRSSNSMDPSSLPTPKHFLTAPYYFSSASDSYAKTFRGFNPSAYVPFNPPQQRSRVVAYEINGTTHYYYSEQTQQDRTLPPYVTSYQRNGTTFFIDHRQNEHCRAQEPGSITNSRDYEAFTTAEEHRLPEGVTAHVFNGCTVFEDSRQHAKAQPELRATSTIDLVAISTDPSEPDEMDELNASSTAGEVQQVDQEEGLFSEADTEFDSDARPDTVHDDNNALAYVQARQQEIVVRSCSQYDKRGKMILDGQMVVHHLNWLGQPILIKSYTPPALSLTIIMMEPKAELWDTEASLYRKALMFSAMIFIDPIIYWGEPATLHIAKGSRLQEMVTGLCGKYYTRNGWSTQDNWAEYEDPPYIDEMDVGKYHPESTIVNGWYENHGVPCREDFWASASRQAKKINSEKEAAFFRRQSSLPQRSPLSQSITVTDVKGHSKQCENGKVVSTMFDEQKDPQSSSSTGSNVSDLETSCEDTSPSEEDTSYDEDEATARTVRKAGQLSPVPDSAIKLRMPLRPTEAQGSCSQELLAGASGVNNERYGGVEARTQYEKDGHIAMRTLPSSSSQKTDFTGTPNFNRWYEDSPSSDLTETPSKSSRQRHAPKLDLTPLPFVLTPRLSPSGANGKSQLSHSRHLFTDPFDKKVQSGLVSLRKGKEAQTSAAAKGKRPMPKLNWVPQCLACQVSTQPHVLEEISEEDDNHGAEEHTSSLVTASDSNALVSSGGSHAFVSQQESKVAVSYDIFNGLDLLDVMDGVEYTFSSEHRYEPRGKKLPPLGLLPRSQGYHDLHALAVDLGVVTPRRRSFSKRPSGTLDKINELQPVSLPPATSTVPAVESSFVRSAAPSPNAMNGNKFAQNEIVTSHNHNGSSPLSSNATRLPQGYSTDKIVEDVTAHCDRDAEISAVSELESEVRGTAAMASIFLRSLVINEISEDVARALDFPHEEAITGGETLRSILENFEPLAPEVDVQDSSLLDLTLEPVPELPSFKPVRPSFVKKQWKKAQEKLQKKEPQFTVVLPFGPESKRKKKGVFGSVRKFLTKKQNVLV